MRLVAAAIVLVLAAGCGGSRPSSKVATSRRATASFSNRVESACLARNQELHQLSRPQTQAEFGEYIASLLSIVRSYRGQLAALHPNDGSRYFAHYRRLLRADEASAVALLEAVRRGNRRAVTRLVTRQRDRSALEQALLRRLRVSC